MPRERKIEESAEWTMKNKWARDSLIETAVAQNPEPPRNAWERSWRESGNDEEQLEENGTRR